MCGMTGTSKMFPGLAVTSCWVKNQAMYMDRQSAGEKTARGKPPKRVRHYGVSIGGRNLDFWPVAFGPGAFKKGQIPASLPYRRPAPSPGAFPGPSKPTAWPAVGRSEVILNFSPRKMPNRWARPNPPPLVAEVIFEKELKLKDRSAVGNRNDENPSRPVGPKATGNWAFQGKSRMHLGGFTDSAHQLLGYQSVEKRETKASNVHFKSNRVHSSYPAGPEISAHIWGTHFLPAVGILPVLADANQRQVYRSSPI